MAYYIFTIGSHGLLWISNKPVSLCDFWLDALVYAAFVMAWLLFVYVEDMNVLFLFRRFWKLMCFDSRAVTDAVDSNQDSGEADDDEERKSDETVNVKSKTMYTTRKDWWNWTSEWDNEELHIYLPCLHETCNSYHLCFPENVSAQIIILL